MKIEDPQSEAQSIKIKCHAERCPVCNGHGTVSYGKVVCKACQGKCFILVPNEIEDDESPDENRGNR